MKFDDALRGHIRLTNQQVKDVWDNCIFCLDTNVYLDLYRYNDSDREALFKVLDKIKDRLFIPTRVAEEFGRNRHKVIRNRFSPYRELTKLLGNARTNITSKFKNHPELGNVLAAIDKMMKELGESIEKRQSDHETLLDDDPILIKLKGIIASDIGEPIPDADIGKEYERRKKLLSPPYCPKDDDKGSLSGEAFGEEERTGDVAIWLEILRRFKGSEKSLVFITRDMKANWWSATGERNIAQPALVKEFFRETTREALFYASEEFLSLAPSKLQVEPTQSLVEATKVLEREDQSLAEAAALQSGEDWKALLNLVSHDVSLRQLRELTLDPNKLLRASHGTYRLRPTRFGRLASLKTPATPPDSSPKPLESGPDQPNKDEGNTSETSSD